MKYKIIKLLNLVMYKMGQECIVPTCDNMLDKKESNYYA